MYERWALGQYNVLFTFVPVLAFGLFDQDVSQEMALEYPQLYQSGLRKQYVSTRAQIIHQCFYRYIYLDQISYLLGSFFPNSSI